MLYYCMLYTYSLGGSTDTVMRYVSIAQTACWKDVLYICKGFFLQEEKFLDRLKFRVGRAVNLIGQCFC